MLAPLCLCLWFSLLIGSFQLGLADGYVQGNDKWHRNVVRRVVPYKTIIVDQSGHGNFSSIQEAINSIPSDNNHWVCIRIKAGIYREKVKIPDDKPYILLKGEGKKRTQIIWNDHYSTAQSPTFTSLADNFVASHIMFVNSYNYPPNKNRQLPAVAAMIAGDKSAFYRCGFAGYQDTLWDDQGRHYFDHCSIQGAVDFIFGMGQSIYETCTIQVIGGGFITAQGRTNPTDANGFVFRNCRVFGYGGLTYLGRPWRSYARVLFYKSNFSNVVDSLGWNAWNSVGKENQITFAEYGNFGPGADTSKRVRWAKKLKPPALKELTSISFIDRENWILKQPL